MIDIHELERRQKIYKYKSYIPYITIFISLLIILSIIIFIFKINATDNMALTKTIQKPIKEQMKKPTLIKKKILVSKKDELNTTKPIKKEVPTAIVQSNKVVISPSLNFMKQLQNNIVLSDYTYQTRVNNSKQINTIQTPKKIVKKRIPEKKEIIQPIQKSNNQNKIRIKKQNTYDDIAHVVKRFNKNNNPTLSLFIAKKYYELAKYDKAYNYALITNDINNEIEASWIIFSKSLVKLNQKDKAIKVLTKYVNHTHSNNAQILLNDIKTGAFK